MHLMGCVILKMGNWLRRTPRSLSRAYREASVHNGQCILDRIESFLINKIQELGTRHSALCRERGLLASLVIPFRGRRQNKDTTSLQSIFNLWSPLNQASLFHGLHKSKNPAAGGVVFCFAEKEGFESLKFRILTYWYKIDYISLIC
jgi:hypothetical protein